MSDIQIIWPQPAELCAEPASKYIDVHNVMGRIQTRITASLAANMKMPNVLLNSKHGLGKTLLAATVAHNLRSELKKAIPMITFDCSEDTKEYHLKGTFSVQPDGSTAYVPGPIPLAIEMANQTGLSLLCFEEISALTPGAQKIINSITDWRTGIFVPQIGKFMRLKPGANIIILATMNPSVYGGVYTLNSDLRSRFVEEVVPWPTLQQEMKILKEVCPWANAAIMDKAVQLAKDSRTPTTEYNLSTRDLVLFLEDSFRLPQQLENILTCVVNKFEGSDRDLMIDRADAIFATKLKQTLKDAA